MSKKQYTNAADILNDAKALTQEIKEKREAFDASTGGLVMSMEQEISSLSRQMEDADEAIDAINKETIQQVDDAILATFENDDITEEDLAPEPEEAPASTPTPQ